MNTSWTRRAADWIVAASPHNAHIHAAGCCVLSHVPPPLLLSNGAAQTAKAHVSQIRSHELATVTGRGAGPLLPSNVARRRVWNLRPRGPPAARPPPFQLHAPCGEDATRKARPDALLNATRVSRSNLAQKEKKIHGEAGGRKCFFCRCRCVVVAAGRRTV
jgi:hypothetical protein